MGTFCPFMTANAHFLKTSIERNVKFMVTLGFIGTGNMGGALARAACKSIPADQVFLSNRTVEKA